MHKWKDTRFMKERVSADAAAEELERIRIEHGGALRANDVVITASDPDNPLHPVFEWDDSVAAHRHREAQARAMLRAIRVGVQDTDTSPVYVNVILDDGDRHYSPVSIVVKHPDLYQQAIDALRKKADELEASAQELEDYAPQRRKAKARAVRDKARELRASI